MNTAAQTAPAFALTPDDFPTAPGFHWVLDGALGPYVCAEGQSSFMNAHAVLHSGGIELYPNAGAEWHIIANHAELLEFFERNGHVRCPFILRPR